MADFPKTEVKLLALMDMLAGGLEKLKDDLPAPPVSAPELRETRRQIMKLIGDINNANAVLAGLHQRKRELFQVAKTDMRGAIRYAEAVFRNTPGRLGELGWGKRRERTPMKPPGQALGLQIAEEGTTWLRLEWRKPADGGPVAVYRVQRRRPPEAWEDIGTLAKRKFLVTDQPRGVQLEFRVIAVNKAGDSSSSHVVEAVL